MIRRTRSTFLVVAAVLLLLVVAVFLRCKTPPASARLLPESDGAFVGTTPSTVSVAPGNRQIAVKKKGFTDWTKTLNVTGGTIHLNADLDKVAAKQWKVSPPV
jgi:hypothetical protein